jgi:RNA 2',3'-cyclic 3'-phosphodiesterase
METVRTFIAVDVPREIKMELDGLIAKLREAAPDIRWVRAANLHLTLRFLGEIARDSISGLAAELDKNLKGFGPFEISLANVGGFPNLKRARVIWVGSGQGSERLYELAPLVEKSCSVCGFEAADKPFSSHLTVGRVKYPKGHERLTSLLDSLHYESPLFSVEEVVVFKSDLMPAGPKYTRLESIRL